MSALPSGPTRSGAPKAASAINLPALENRKPPKSVVVVGSASENRYWYLIPASRITSWIRVTSPRGPYS